MDAQSLGTILGAIIGGVTAAVVVAYRVVKLVGNMIDPLKREVMSETVGAPPIRIVVEDAARKVEHNTSQIEKVEGKVDGLSEKVHAVDTRLAVVETVVKDPRNRSGR